ncbi:MAG: MBL fold metallo-hydrolase, partial [Bacteroidota bacterium]
DAGHILGSASILIEYNKQRMFYTGDIKISSQRIMNGAILPEGSIDILITESTYASSESKNIGTLISEGKRFVKEANKVLASGGSILIPVFSLGKMQEVLMFLFNKMKSGTLTETHIFTGGIGRKISHLYDLNRFLINRKYEKVKLSEIEQINYFDIQNPDFYQRHPSIVLAASGMMLENTMSNKLMKYWIHKNVFSIFIVGYMDPSTPGYMIASNNQGDEIEIGIDKKVKIKCSVNRFHFPSHSTREELLNIVDRTNPKRVILVHGEPEAKEWLGHQILKLNNNVKVHSASIGSSIMLNGI